MVLAFFNSIVEPSTIFKLLSTISYFKDNISPNSDWKLEANAISYAIFVGGSRSIGLPSPTLIGLNLKRKSITPLVDGKERSVPIVYPPPIFNSYSLTKIFSAYLISFLVGSTLVLILDVY